MLGLFFLLTPFRARRKFFCLGIAKMRMSGELRTNAKTRRRRIHAVSFASTKLRRFAAALKPLESGIRRTNCQQTEFIVIVAMVLRVAVGQKLIKPLAVSLVLIDPPAERSPEAC